MSQNITLHFFLIGFSFAPTLLTLVLRSTLGVSTHTCHCQSSFLAALTQLFCQEPTRRDHLALFFLSSVHIFVDDITALLMVKNKVAAEMALLPRPSASMNKDREVVLCFPRCCCHLSLQFSFSPLGAIPTAWTPQVLAGIIPARKQLLDTHFHLTLWKILSSSL